MDLKKLVGVRIRQARRDADLNQQDAADRIGVSQGTWAGYEQGKINVPLDTLQRISEILGKPVEYFVTENYSYEATAPLPKAESPGARAKRRKAA